MRRRLGGLSGAVIFGLATVASAAQLTVGAGSTLDLGSGSLDLGCAGLVVAGTLAAGTNVIDWAQDVSVQPGGTLNGESATLYVTGDWSNSGTFSAGTSSVNFIDGCDRTSATISGGSTFATLSMTTAIGKLYSFQAGSTQTITGSLTLAGASGNLLTIRSTVNGNEAFLDLQGSQAVDFVDVKDNHAIGHLILMGLDSVNSGNAPGWWVAAGIPALSAAALALLMLAIMWAGCRGLRVKEDTARTP